jgi:hypothetical protein
VTVERAQVDRVRGAAGRPRGPRLARAEIPSKYGQRRKLKAMLTKKQICARMPILRMLSRVSFRLAVSDARVALPDFYNVAIRIANVAARLAVFGLWLGDELGPPAFP